MKRYVKAVYTLAVLVGIFCCNFILKDGEYIRHAILSFNYTQQGLNNIKSRLITKEDEQIKVKPLYQLDPKRFLIPSLHNGPNNQLIAFQQSVFLSILLNRTLVIPVFYLHSLNINKHMLKPTIDAELRMDLGKLRNLLSTKTIQQASNLCHGKFDALFLPRYKPWNKYANILPKVHLETEIRGLIYKKQTDINSISSQLNSTNFDIATLVDHPDERCLIGELYTGIKTEIATSLNTIRSHFNTTKACALYLNPFRELGINIASKYTSSLSIENMKTISDSALLLQNISRHIIPPVLVRDLSRNFIKSFITPSSFVSVHWRYDEEDFFSYLCGPGQRKAFCDTIRLASNATAFAHALFDRVNTMGKNTTEYPAVYIASPASVSDFIEGVKEIFRSLAKNSNQVQLKKIRIFSSHELYKFLKKSKRFDGKNNPRYSTPILLDILSQVEMEICCHSDVFIWSRQSTWSKLVLERRLLIFGKNDENGENVVNFILKTMEGMANFRLNQIERKKLMYKEDN